MKQNIGNMKYKIKDLQDGQIYTVSELADKLCVEERCLRNYINNNKKIYGKKYIKEEV